MTTPAAPFTLATKIPLNNGIQMPLIHLGVYMTSGRETSQMVSAALRAGYLAIDSAAWYYNEAEVGSAMLSFLKQQDQNSSSSTTSTSASASSSEETKKRKALTREDLWFTSKLKDNISYDAARKSIKKSIRESGMGYLDLYLLHSPYGGKKKRLECWRAVEDACLEGEVRAIGVSNYGVKHLQELLSSNPRIPPAINQIEVHPFNTNSEIVSFCQSHNILVQAYAPLAKAMRFRHPTVVQLAKKYGCSPAQLLIKWSVQMGYAPIPKSSHEKRIIENGKAGTEGRPIEEEDLGVLADLDEGLVTDWDPTDAA